MRGDVLPPKRQAVVDRLRRRIELYRRHHNAVLPRQGQANSAVSEDQRQETLLLKQRYLESKAKKAKKSEHKTLKDTSGAAATSSADSHKNHLQVMQTSAMFPNVGFGSQALTTTIQSNFRTDGAVRSGSSLPGVVFGKANGAQNPYVVQNNPVDATRRQAVSQMPLRLQEQQKCAPKGTQYSNSSIDEKTAFVNNFKASLAQFNEVNNAPSPPLVKSPSQFSKQMSSSMNSQASIMMGPSNHGAIQTVHDHSQYSMGQGSKLPL
ncbi:hypothetical protein V5799_018043 [Amblyomma americanum]|uniref:Neurogenic mastermind-like N-terminal domain-containing protein n=1 Tax=Amblyomma americanum TaxID=6943 RepID=A0AAQ4E1B6_AMBAM